MRMKERQGAKEGERETEFQSLRERIEEVRRKIARRTDKNSVLKVSRLEIYPSSNLSVFVFHSTTRHCFFDRFSKLRR